MQDTVEVIPQDLVAVAREVQRLPYRWPAPPDADATEAAGSGTCAGKHALLARKLHEFGVEALPLLVVGRLAPPLWPDLARAGDGLLEVHECLTVLTPWQGPLTVDVTWHPSAVDAGLPGLSPDWDGLRDVDVAIEVTAGCYAVPVDRLREAKEALRARLYSPADRARRDHILEQIASRAARL